MPLLPHDSDAEAAVLGACLMNREAIVAVAPLLTPEMFYWPKHADVYRAIVTCYQRRVPPDIRTITDALRDAGTLDRIGGVVFLSQLVDAVPTAYHAPYYAGIVAKHAERRATIAAGGKIAALGYRDDLSAEELRAEALTLLTTGAARDAGGFEPIGDVFERLWLQREAGAATGLLTGYADLDRLLGGLAPGNLILICGIPGSGKSAFAMNLAWQLARRGAPVGVVSLEMTADELGQRITAQESGVDTVRQRSSDLDGPELAAIIRLNNERSTAPLFIEDHGPLTPADVRVRALRLHAEHGPLGLLVVDYLGLLALDVKRMTVAQAMNAAAQDMKNLASELRCPVILLSQLNRDIFRRADRRPLLSDVREAGEAPASQIIVIHRDAAFDPEAERQGEADFYLIKNRHGRTGMATLGYIGERTLFTNLDRYRDFEGY